MLRPTVARPRCSRHRQQRGIFESAADVVVGDDADLFALRLDRAAVAEAERDVRLDWAGRRPAAGSLEKWNTSAPGVCSASSTGISRPLAFRSRYCSNELPGMSAPDLVGRPLG